MSNSLIPPVPLHGDEPSRADRIALIKTVLGDSAEGRRIVHSLRHPRRGGRANDGADRERQQMEKLSKFYAQQGRGPNQAA